MINLNRIEIIGNLTKDPELRFTPTNQAVAQFSVATNRRYRDPQGNWQDSPPEYHEVVVWGPLGERCNQLLHKGDRIYATGRLQTRSWEAQDGSKRYKTELVADTIIGPDQVNKGTGAGAADGIYDQAPQPAASSAPAPRGKAASSSATPPPTDDEINIDDIPF